jgi:hypothetical protein
MFGLRLQSFTIVLWQKVELNPLYVISRIKIVSVNNAPRFLAAIAAVDVSALAVDVVRTKM